MSLPMTIDRRTKFLILVAILIIWTAALSTMPFMAPWGADLQNVHAYQQCVAGRSPYQVDATTCGDVAGRPFYYPPFLFAFFRWARPLTLQTTMYIWTAFMFASFAGIFYVWARKILREPPSGERHEVVTFCTLLLFQYPFVFALERGNTDTVVVLFYTLAAYLFVRGHVWFAGMAAGLAAGFRLSPAVAVIVMTGGLLWGRQYVGRLTWLRWSGGALMAFVLTLLVFFRESKTYLFDVLPVYAKQLSYAAEYSHSIPSFVGDGFKHYGKVLGVGLLFPWVWAIRRMLARGEVAIAIAGSLAVSTYIQSTSFDYNLISTYPLLLLLLLRAQRTDRWSLLGFGLFAICGDRRLFATPGAKLLTPQLHLALQLAFFVVAALVIARPDEKEGQAQPA